MRGFHSDAKDAVHRYINSPAYISSIAHAISYDLNYGPSWLLIPSGDLTLVNDDCVSLLREDLEDARSEGDIIEQTYTGSASQALRDFIDGLPSTLYWEEDSGFISDSEPQGMWIDEDCEECDSSDDGAAWSEPPAYYAIENRDIVECLFGKTIASEFL